MYNYVEETRNMDKSNSIRLDGSHRTKVPLFASAIVQVPRTKLTYLERKGLRGPTKCEMMMMLFSCRALGKPHSPCCAQTTV
jgi:hypothetical protein